MNHVIPLGYAKGWLMALVIFAHTIPRARSEDPLKWFFYSFFLAIFFWISGYHVSLQRLSERSIRESLAPYTSRLLPPWFVVAVAWSLFVPFMYWQRPNPLVYALSGAFVAAFVADHFLRRKVVVPTFLVAAALLVSLPFNFYRISYTLGKVGTMLGDYHLWFIPALFLMGVATRLVSRYERGVPALALVSLAAALFYPLFGRTPLVGPWVSKDPSFFQYLVCFLAGCWQRNSGFTLRWNDLRQRTYALLLIGLGCLCLVSSYRDARYGLVFSFGAALLNLPVLAMAPDLLGRVRPGGYLGAVICTLGRHSLWIYLLHPFATIFFVRWSKPLHLLDYAIGLGETAVIIAVVYWLTLVRRKVRTVRRVRLSDGHPVV